MLRAAPNRYVYGRAFCLSEDLLRGEQQILVAESDWIGC